MFGSSDAGCAFGVSCSQSEPRVAPVRPNVLFLSIDDLNDADLSGYYTEASFSTPNMDALAAEGVKFTRAFSTSPACLTSRTALLTGIGPATSGLHYQTGANFDFRNAFPVLTEVPSIPQWFKERGYYIVGAGKLFHDPNDDGSSAAPNARLTLWDETYRYTVGSGGTIGGSFIDDLDIPGGIPTNGLTGLVFTDPDGIMSSIAFGYDWGYFEADAIAGYTGIEDATSTTDRTTWTPDWWRMDWARDEVAEAATRDQPTFVSVGFYRPHVPLYCPKSNFDGVAAPVTEPPILANDIDDIDEPMGGPSTYADFEFAAGRDGIDYPNQFVRSYFACVEFVDELVGDLIAAVDASPEPWIVVLWGDHGFHLGEKGRLTKFTLWDRGSHTSLIFRGYGIEPGSTVSDMVTLVDVYPTLTELAGIPAPDHLEGKSLMKYLNGSLSGGVTYQKATFNNEVWESWRGDVSGTLYSYIEHESGAAELYNLGTDPNEQTNLLNDGTSVPEQAVIDNLKSLSRS